MSRQDQVVALLAEANPVADPREFRREPAEVPELTSLRPLADDGERVTQRSRKQLVAAAAAIVLIGLLAVLFSQTNEDPVIASTTTVVSPDELEGSWEALSFGLILDGSSYSLVSNDLVVDQGNYEAIEESTLRFVSDAGSANCVQGDVGTYSFSIDASQLTLEPIDDDCSSRGLGVSGSNLSSVPPIPTPPSALDVVREWGSASGAGRYEATVFSPAFEITVPQGWRSLAPELVGNLSMSGPPTALHFHVHPLARANPETTVEEVVALFTSHPSLIVTEPQPAEIGGASGLSFSYTSPEPNDLIQRPGEGALNVPPDRMFSAWVVDVDGTAVIVVSHHPPGTSDEKLSEVERIVNSIVWKDLE